MAVTIHDTPVSYTPSDNPIVWTFSSNQTAQDNFVYLVEVFINDVSVANEFVFPDNGIYARFDASGIASRNCLPPIISDTLIVDANNYCDVRITVTERYGSPPDNEASAAASNVTAWKARMLDEDYIDWIGGDYADYIYGAPGLWLTNHPNYPKVREENEQIRLMLINGETNLSDFEVELFDSDGVSIVSDTLNYTGTSSKLLICNLTPSVIIASALSITAINFQNAAYYEVSADSLSGMLVQRIDIDRSLVYSTYKRIHYLSTYGSIESFSFGLLSRESGTVKSFGYRQGFGQWSGSSFVFSKEQGRDIDYAKTVDKSLKLISDWLTQAEQNYIADNLYSSPLVYQEQGALMIRRSMESKTYDKRIQENDMIFLEEVTLKLPTYNSAVI